MRTISPERLRHELHARPALIPITINFNRGQVIWCDPDAHQFTEPVFADFLVSLSNNPNQYDLFSCDFEALENLELPANCLSPRGFIFHTGRCGSTLFSRALARSASHIVMSEAAVHNEIWWRITNNWRDAVDPDRLPLFAKLVCLTGRSQSDSQTAYFVKFSSWQALFLKHIFSRFPDVPCVFLYRDPLEILASLTNEAPAWLAKKDTAFGAFCAGLSVDASRAHTKSDYLESYLANLFYTALQTDNDKLKFMNYRDLTADGFQAVLERCFDYRPGSETLAMMQAQFGVYSKDVSGTRAFSEDRKAKRENAPETLKALASGRLQDLYQQAQAKRAA